MYPSPPQRILVSKYPSRDRIKSLIECNGSVYTAQWLFKVITWVWNSSSYSRFSLYNNGKLDNFVKKSLPINNVMVLERLQCSGFREIILSGPNTLLLTQSKYYFASYTILILLCFSHNLNITLLLTYNLNIALLLTLS